MITVNLLMPFAGNCLKIACEEDIQTDCLMERIRAAASSYELMGKAVERKWLCHVEKRHILAHDQTLTECGLIDGSNLIMI